MPSSGIERGLLVLLILGLLGCACDTQFPTGSDGPTRSDGTFVDPEKFDGGTPPAGDGPAAHQDASTGPDQFEQDSAPPPSPTTWDPQVKQQDIVLSSDRLTASQPEQPDSVNNSVQATVGKLKGKRYWEVTVVALGSGSYHSVGFSGSDGSGSMQMGPEHYKSGCGYLVQGSIRCEKNQVFIMTGVAKIAPGDIVGVALDLDSERVYFRHNGSWQAGASPATGSGGQSFSISASPKGIFPWVNISKGDAMRANFGASPLAHPAPAGFQPGW